MKRSEMKIGLGTAAIGRPSYINIKKEERSKVFVKEEFRQKGIDLIEKAYQEGIRYFDTAPGYGMAEQLIVDWLKNKNDASIEIATKWGYTYVANFDPKATVHEVKEHSLGKLEEQWSASQELLPYLTSYQIHSATFETGVLENEKVLTMLAKLKKEHGIHIGLTTTGSNQIEVLKRALDVQVEGAQIFDLFQVTYNIFDQSIAPVASEISRQNKRLVIKEALANGRIFLNEKYPHYAKAYEILKRLARKYNVGVDAVALRFCIDSIPIFKVLSGAANEQHITDNIKAAHFELSIEDMASLNDLAISPQQYWNERTELSWN